MKQWLLVLLVVVVVSTAGAIGLNEKEYSFSNGIHIIISDTKTSVFGDDASWSISVTNRSNTAATYKINLWPSKISYRGDVLRQYSGMALTNSLPSLMATNHTYSIPFHSYLPWDNDSISFEATIMTESAGKYHFSAVRSGLSVPKGLISVDYFGETQGDAARLQSILSYCLPINTTNLTVRLVVDGSNIVERSYANKPQGAHVIVTNTMVNPAAGSYMITGQVFSQEYSFDISPTNVFLNH